MLSSAFHQLLNHDQEALKAHFDLHIRSIKTLKNAGDTMIDDYKFDVTSAYAWEDFCASHEVKFARLTNPLHLEYKSRKDRNIMGLQLKEILKVFHGFVRYESGIPKNSLDDLKKKRRFCGLQRSLKTGSPEVVAYNDEMRAFDYFCVNPKTFICVQDTDYGDLVEIKIENWKVKTENDYTPAIVRASADDLLLKMQAANVEPWHPVMSEFNAHGMFKLRYELSKNRTDARLVDGSLWISSELTESVIAEASKKLKKITT